MTQADNTARRNVAVLVASQAVLGAEKVEIIEIIESLPRWLAPLMSVTRTVSWVA